MNYKKCDHSDEIHWAVLNCGVVYYALQGGSNFLNEVPLGLLNEKYKKRY